MRRFLFCSALFLGIVALVFGSIGAVELAYEIKAYHRELKAPPECEILVANDSQFAMGVDPSVDGTFFNFSAHGRTMDQTYLTLIDVFRANPGLFRQVLIDLSPSASADRFDQKIPDMGYASQYYLLHWLHPAENRRDMTGEIAVFRDNMVGRRWRLFWRSLRGRATFTSSICGKFSPVCESLAKQSPGDFKGQYQARSRHVNSSDAVTPESPVFAHVADIVRLVRSEGAEPVLVTTPWHPLLRSACRRERLVSFTNAVATVAGRLKCRYVNCLEDSFPDDCWYDAQHLNVRGARRFTPLLRERVKARTRAID